MHNPSASSLHELSMSLAYTFHPSSSHWVTLFSFVCNSRSNRHILPSYIACLASYSRTSSCASQQRQPKISSSSLFAFPHSESSSNQLLLCADQVKLSSRHSHVVLLDRASCRALVSGLALCLLHSEAPNFCLQCVDSCRLLGLCHPASHGPDYSWDCRRVLHRIPPNEIDQHGPSDLGLHSSRCTQPCKCFNAAIFKLCTFSENCSQIGSFTLRRERILGIRQP